MSSNPEVTVHKAFWTARLVHARVYAYEDAPSAAFFLRHRSKRYCP